eukprot:GHVN01082810.1.p1 GENE.GHVN01082810.1~~GHVN01082810.1.p1  ORF type:complete len:707 (-),score=125.69 GHVN01082810.1:2255-4348(-)
MRPQQGQLPPMIIEPELRLPAFAPQPQAPAIAPTPQAQSPEMVLQPQLGRGDSIAPTYGSSSSTSQSAGPWDGIVSTGWGDVVEVVEDEAVEAIQDEAVEAIQDEAVEAIQDESVEAVQDEVVEAVEAGEDETGEEVEVEPIAAVEPEHSSPVQPSPAGNEVEPSATQMGQDTRVKMDEAVANTQCKYLLMRGTGMDGVFGAYDVLTGRLSFRSSDLFIYHNSQGLWVIDRDEDDKEWVAYIFDSSSVPPNGIWREWSERTSKWINHDLEFQCSISEQEITELVAAGESTVTQTPGDVAPVEGETVDSSTSTTTKTSRQAGEGGSVGIDDARNPSENFYMANGGLLPIGVIGEDDTYINDVSGEGEAELGAHTGDIVPPEMLPPSEEGVSSGSEESVAGVPDGGPNNGADRIDDQIQTTIPVSSVADLDEDQVDEDNLFEPITSLTTTGDIPKPETSNEPDASSTASDVEVAMAEGKLVITFTPVMWQQRLQSLAKVPDKDGVSAALTVEGASGQGAAINGLYTFDHLAEDAHNRPVYQKLNFFSASETPLLLLFLPRLGAWAFVSEKGESKTQHIVAYVPSYAAQPIEIDNLWRVWNGKFSLQDPNIKLAELAKADVLAEFNQQMEGEAIVATTPNNRPSTSQQLESDQAIASGQGIETERKQPQLSSDLLLNIFSMDDDEASDIIDSILNVVLLR